MAVAKKKGLNNSQQKLLAILKEHASTKTVEEIAPLYAAAMGKDEAKETSITTALSQIRNVFKLAGKKFPASLEPVKKSGGGRASNQVDVADALSGMGIDFDDLDDVPVKAS